MFVRQSVMDIIGLFPGEDIQKAYRLEFERMITITGTHEVYTRLLYLREKVDCGDLNDIELALLYDYVDDIYQDNTKDEVFDRFADLMKNVKFPPKVIKTWTVVLEEIEDDSGDCFLPIPDELGWKEGDNLLITVVDTSNQPYAIIRKI